jgi:hypothetical protein
MELHRFGVRGGEHQARISVVGDVLLRDALRERATDVHLDSQAGWRPRAIPNRRPAQWHRLA